MLINSRHNERIKTIASLKQKKFRDELGLYLVEGIKMVREAFSFGMNVKTVVATTEFASEFCDKCDDVIEVSEDVLDFVSDAVTPQGVIAVLEVPKYPLVHKSGVSVCLDGVSDAGNLGTILRIMASVAVKDIYLVDCVDTFSPKTVRSSMSGIYLVNIHKVNFEEFSQLVKPTPIVIADMNGENVFEADVQGDFCLLLGSEAHGVSDRMKALATKTLKIPMKQNMESLNVGVSAGIILFQLLKNTF